MFDVIIIGSGASSVNAAVPLVESGLRVLMLDYGAQDRQYSATIPSESFRELRTSDPNQHRYFLGDEFEGISLEGVRVGSQLTPPRAFITQDTERLLPLRSESYRPLLSLARGGLAAGWGGLSACYDSNDLMGEALNADSLTPHYQRVAQRIGISGASDDGAAFLGDIPLLPAFEPDTPSELLLKRYAAKKIGLNRRGLYLSLSRLALTTQKLGEREANANHDMDFWADQGKSLYRPQWTLEELQKRDNFQYVNGRLAVGFHEEGENRVRVDCAHSEAPHIRESYEGRALVIGAGVHATARIVLKSLKAYGVRRPIVCNPYIYIPMINLNAIGKPLRDSRHSMAQLCAFHVPTDGRSELVVGQYYSYRSLLNFKLQKESPFPHKEGIELLRALTPLLGIVGIHFADWPSDRKTCWLEEDGQDTLRVEYLLDPQETEKVTRGRKAIARLFRSLGCFPFQLVSPAPGSSIHYGGTFPMCVEEREFTCTPDGKLRGTNAVYLCDGSLWSHLPAKGITFTLMANADRIGMNLAQRMKNT